MSEKVSEFSERLRKLEELKSLGIEPYPARSERSHEIFSAIANFEVLEKSGEVLTFVGRLRSFRQHGNLSFGNLDDGTGSIQVAFSKAEVGVDNYKLLSKLIDVGDFLQVSGKFFLTHKEEKSLMVGNFKLLSKALRPLPDKFHGLQDEEERLRKRYLDILSNPEVKEMVLRRSAFWRAMRDFLLAENFLEVETPVLENTAGGADARPFTTHHNALDIDVYLRISMGELWQKRLMVAGLPKTFEIGRQFRNEGISAEHLQDYTQMECYWAYADYHQGMEMVKRLYRQVIERAFGKLQFSIGNFEVDFSADWPLYDYRQTILEKTGVDIGVADLPSIESRLKELSVSYDAQGFNLARGVDLLWKYCRKQIAGPGFLVGVPVYMETLAKRRQDKPELVERFQVILAGSEMGKGFSELNDPVDQAERFRGQQQLRDEGDEEAQMADHEFVEALEYGMPPTFGFGVSERLFSFLMNKPARECQIFPLLRPRHNDNQKDN
jgi:lysyl-tRNA synthetase class 2